MSFDHNFKWNEDYTEGKCSVCSKTYVPYTSQGECLSVAQRFEKIEKELAEHIENHPSGSHEHLELMRF